jgi:hypothetical protein
MCLCHLRPTTCRRTTCHSCHRPELPSLGERVWAFWRRVYHTCHHHTQIQEWLRLAGVTLVPAIYGPSGDVTWDEADPTYSLAAADRPA